MSEPLSNDDFTIEDAKLRLLRKGPYAALFMAKNEAGSMSLIKILKTIQVPGMQTGYLDITQGKNKDVITLSRKTKAPISSVPYLAIFYDGKLKFRYKGDVDTEKIRSYCQNKVIEMANELKMPVATTRQTVGSTSQQQFAMARQQTGAASDATKNAPDATKVGIIGYNKAHLIDMMKH